MSDRISQQSLVAEIGIICVFCLLLAMPENGLLHLFSIFEMILWTPARPLWDLIVALRFTTRYLRLVEGKLHSALNTIELKTLYNRHTQLPAVSYVLQSSNAKSEQILSIEHLFQLDARNLCHEDVLNLSRASRLVRELVLSARHLPQRLRKLRASACTAPACLNRIACWDYNTQLCDACQSP